jgi:predicted permease
MFADFKYSLRSISKAPSYYSLVVLILGLGIGVTVSVFSLVDGVVFRPLPYCDSSRLVAVESVATKPPFDGNGSFSYDDFEQLRANTRAFEEMAVMYRIGWSQVVRTDAGQTEKLRGGFVSANFFTLLGRAPVMGHVFSREEEAQGAHVLLLSEPFATRRFGSAESAVGRDLEIAKTKWRIIGVMPADFRVPFLDSQIWGPVTSHPDWNDRAEPDSRQRAARWDLMARLKPGVSMAAAQAEIDVIYGALRDKAPEWHNDRALVVPLRDHFTMEARKPFAILSVSVGLLLLIACANVSNLLLARAASRQREFAVRAALGAGVGRLLRQALVETTSLCMMAGPLGVGLSLWLVKLLKIFVPAHTPRIEDVSINARVLLFSIVLTLAMGMILGLTSVWSGIRRNVAQPLNNASRSLTGGTRQKSVLVVCEFALAMVLLTGSALLIRSFVAVLRVDPGFRPEHVLTMRIEPSDQMSPTQVTRFYRDAIQRIRNVPGIQAVGAVNWVFQGPTRTHSLRVVEGRESEPVEKWDALEWSRVSGDYFHAMGIPLVYGRLFEERDGPTAPPVVIVNETLARRYWPGENPIGKRAKGWDPRGTNGGKNDDWLTVVGVVKDIRGGGRERKPFAQIYEVQSQRSEETNMFVIRTTGDPAQATSGVRAAILDTNPDVSVAAVSTMEQVLAEQEAQRQFETWIIGLFSAVALGLAALGVFAVMHFTVAARTREIGIRMAVGARAADILHLVIGSGAKLAIIGIAAGALASIWVTDALAGMLFAIQPTDPWSFAGAAVVLTTVAIAACFFPALRAAHLDPISALRDE